MEKHTADPAGTGRPKQYTALELTIDLLKNFAAAGDQRAYKAFSQVLNPSECRDLPARSVLRQPSMDRLIRDALGICGSKLLEPLKVEPGSKRRQVGGAVAYRGQWLSGLLRSADPVRAQYNQSLF